MSNSSIVKDVASSYRLEMIVVGLIVAMSVINPIVKTQWELFEETRFYRDLAGLTPFRSVIIEKVTIENNEITISGTLVKQRDCEIVVRSAWARDWNGVLRRATVIIGGKENPPPIKRPVSDEPQAMGPITIRPDGDFVPQDAVLFLTHECWVDSKNENEPRHLERQSNKFFDVEWKDTP